MNYYLFSGFEQHEFIFLYIWTSKVWNQFQWAKIKMLVGLHSLPRFYGRITSLPFLTSRGLQHLLTYGPLFHPQSQQHSVFPPLLHLLLSLCLLHSLISIWVSCIPLTGIFRIIPNAPRLSRIISPTQDTNLIICAKTVLPGKVTNIFTGSRD